MKGACPTRRDACWKFSVVIVHTVEVSLNLLHGGGAAVHQKDGLRGWESAKKYKARWCRLKVAIENFR
jgi:hypothetical protein